MASVCSVQAAQVDVSEARQVAAKFFAASPAKFAAQNVQLRLAYTAEANRFYIFDRNQARGFVIVAGDDRLPQVLGYSDTGYFNSGNIPISMQDWMAEMNREIAFIQSHKDAVVHQPIKRMTPVEPLMTTLWDQDWPYNNLCPTYTAGDTALRAVTGCVATAMTQIMNYHQWPLQGTGSHTYNCNVNDTDPTTLSADFSQSFYEWDKMLDYYDENSSEESCYAVAKLMSDAGISINMGYGSSSGAQETAVLSALTNYFGYSDRHYLLQRDLFSADEWDQLLFEELSAGRPILYCGYAIAQGQMSGHAFVFDGFDDRGYFHVNWGWGGAGDGYFMASVLAPQSGYNFKYGQDGIFGVVPAHDAALVPDFLSVRGVMHPDMYSVPRGQKASLKFSDIYVQGNLLDSVGVENMGYWPAVYDTIPMELRVIDGNGEMRQYHRFGYKVYISGWGPRPSNIDFTPVASLENGEYTVKIAYASHKDGNYDTWVCDEYGKDVYCKMLVSDDMVYLSDCLLAEKYDLESMTVDNSIFVDEPFNVDVTLSYSGGGYGPPGSQTGTKTTGDIHLLLLKDGEEVATSDPMTISLPFDSTATYRLQMTAPSQWGRYELQVVDESGRLFTYRAGWYDEPEGGSMMIMVVPQSEELIEDFETMQANGKTNDANVQGRFTSWTFSKCGVRAPGEGKCNGVNSVMMKKPSLFYSVEPVKHDIFMATATFYNNSTTTAKFTLEYSVDGAQTWEKAMTIDDSNTADIPGSSIFQAMWQLDLKSTDAALFRVSMIGGGSAAVYLDDFILRYSDTSVAGDINRDGEVNIADVNAVIGVILGFTENANADVNGDGEVNIADVNSLVRIILGM